VIVLDHLTEEERQAYRLAVSLTGFSDAELDQLLALDVGGGETTEGPSVPPVVVPEPPRNRRRGRAISGSSATTGCSAATAPAPGEVAREN